MDFTRAFTYIFDDKNWTEKTVLTVVLSFLCAVPLFGLLAVAALSGYSVLILQNMRDGYSDPLPRWVNFGDRIATGANVLVAGIVYGVPNVIFGAIIAIISGFLGGSEFFAAGFTLTLICCFIPLILVYNFVTWPMFALGTIRFSESGNIGVFFQFGDLFATLGRNLNATVEWCLYTLLAGFIISLMGVIPCIGWLASAAISMPVMSHLLGQFAARIEDGPKRKSKRREYE